MPQPDIGREVVRKVLVYRVVGVDQRTAAFMSDALGKGEGGELALAVNDVRLPVDQLLHERIVQPCPKTRIGVDHADADRANKKSHFLSGKSADRWTASGFGHHAPPRAAPSSRLVTEVTTPLMTGLYSR